MLGSVTGWIALPSTAVQSNGVNGAGGRKNGMIADADWFARSMLANVPSVSPPTHMWLSFELLPALVESNIDSPIE